MVSFNLREKDFITTIMLSYYDMLMIRTFGQEEDCEDAKYVKNPVIKGKQPIISNQAESRLWTGLSVSRPP